MALLLVLYLAACVDRMIFAVLAPAIQPALGLTNAQLGFVQGPAYALPYAAALPFAGWLGDRWRAHRVLAGSILVWSAGLLLCASASGLATVVAGRALCGVGQAAVMPVALGAIWRTVSPNRAGRSIALFTATGTLGRSAAFGLGGLLLAWFAQRGVGGAWSAVLVVLVGINALLLAALLATGTGTGTLAGAEPTPGPAASRSVGRQSLWSVVRDAPARVAATVAAALGPVVVVQAVTAWVASTLTQTHHLPVARAGGLIALAGLAAPLGHVTGGWIVDRAAGPRTVGLAQAALATTCVPATMAIAFAESIDLAVGGVAVLMLVAGAGAVAGLERVQRLVPASIRGRANGVFLLLAAAIGSGGGPWAVGLLAGRGAVGTALVYVVAVTATIAAVGAFVIAFTADPDDPGTVA
ncbi:MAG: MFS transporter [Janthinobacterium lividum]